MTTLPISDIVRINTIISPVTRPVADRKTLFLTKDTTLDAGGSRKYKDYTGLNSLGMDFGSASEPYKAAQTFFSQSPYPRDFMVGRWAEAAANTEVRGGAPASVGDISGTALNDGSFAIGGVPVASISIAANDSYTQIAAAVQTAMQAVNAFSAATCVYVANRFVLTFLVAVGVDAVAVDHTAGTDLAELLGLDADSGATVHIGSVAETISEALGTIKSANPGVYFAVLESTINDTDDMELASNWASANRVFLAIESNASPLVASTYRDNLYAKGPPHTLLVVTDKKEYKAASAVARLSSVDYTAPNSVTTLKFRILPNTTPDAYEKSQVINLQNNFANFYVRYGGFPTFGEGTMLDGGWADELAWQDWFAAAVELEVFSLLRRAPKVPITQAGLQTLRGVVEGPCRQGVTNGGLAPNQVSDQLAAMIRESTGDNGFDGFLSTGYLISIPKIGNILQSSRDARTLPAFDIFGKGAGAVHGFVANFTFER